MTLNELAPGVYGISHVSFLVPDLASTIEFYQTIFGFEIQNDFVSPHTGRRYVTMGRETFSIELTESQTDVSEDLTALQGRLQHIAFHTQGIEDVVRQLKEKGAEITRDVTNGTGTIRFAYLRDPNGFTIELFDEGNPVG